MKKFLFALATLTLVGCSNAPTMPAKAEIGGVTAPATAKVGQPVEVRVPVATGACDAYIHVERPSVGADRSVQLEAKVVYANPGTVCPAILVVQDVIVTFTPDQPGTYTIKGGRTEVKVEVAAS